jgi:uncharacterized protein YcnI
MSAQRSFARLLAFPAAVIGFSALAMAPALAHVTISPGQAVADTDTVGTVSVPHGCDGSPTTKVTIKIPDQLVEVAPTRNAFWDVQVIESKLATPLKAADGDAITQKVTEIVYTAKTALPANERDAFELSFHVPAKVGDVLLFPTIQKCEVGEADWTQTVAPGAAEPENPAPAITIVKAAATNVAAPVAAVIKTSDGASKGLAYTGLVVGALGLLTAVGALLAGRRKA